MTDSKQRDTIDLCAFLIGRKGVLYLVRANGKRVKLGVALRQGKFWFWDRTTSTWHKLPDVIPTTAGHAVSIMALRVD